LTFDDGLKEHYAEVMPILDEHRIQGVFLLTTSSLEGRVASVHKNHFLMASLEFDHYRRVFSMQLAEKFPGLDTHVDSDAAERTHRFDPPEVARFKYLLNYQLPAGVRNDILDTLFAEFLGAEEDFARELYLTWDDAREMQRANMSVGGHSHAHRALTTLAPEDRRNDLATCTRLLRAGLREQDLWPFSYPHGDTDDLTNAMLRDLGFVCGFTVRIGPRQIEHPDLFRIQRIDATEVAI
jgi:peptidoglycan/xylan/chitin deacetylase (PgdA/CDA1 family)